MLRVVKKNKRLSIVDPDGNTVYTPPDFLRSRVNRELLGRLAQTEMKIADIIVFETRVRPV